jgi:hypothetical protein
MSKKLESIITWKRKEVFLLIRKIRATRNIRKNTKLNKEIRIQKCNLKCVIMFNNQWGGRQKTAFDLGFRMFFEWHRGYDVGTTEKNDTSGHDFASSLQKITSPGG